MNSGGDRLARGARKATFAAGGSKVEDPIELKNIYTGDAEPDATGNDTPLATPVIKPQASFTPMYDRVLVRRVDEETRTEGGLYIPDEAKDRPAEGIVLAVGFGRVDDGKLKKLYLKGGERVLFGKYAGTEVKLNGEIVLIMREDEILGTVGEALAQ